MKVPSINNKTQTIVNAMLPTLKVKVIYIVGFFVLMMTSAMNNLLVSLHLWRTISFFLSSLILAGFIVMGVTVMVRFYQVKRQIKQ